MSLPTITGVGRLTGDPSLSIAANGKPYAKFTVAFNARRQNQQTGEWEDGDAFFARSTVWGQMAEHVAESLSQGTEVQVTGTIRSTQWTDKDSGETKYGTEVTIQHIGPTLRFNTVAVKKVERQGTAS